ncbi:MAG: PAS domain S-box protein, partial [Armatimonadota bacterium]
MSQIRTLLPGQWSLAVKLTCATAFMIVAGVAILTVRSVRSEEDTYRAELKSQAQLLLNALAASAADPLYNLDAARLTDMMSGLSGEGTVVSGRVYDLKGQIIADAHDRGAALHLERDPYGLQLVVSDSTMFVWHSDHLLAGRAVTAGRQRLGAVSVGLSTAPLAAKVAAVRREGLMVATAAATLGILLALLISRSITGPLKALTSATQRFARGDLTEKITVRGGDELAVLADAFNSMTTQIGGMTEALEQRILERTEELRMNEEALREAKAFLEHLIGTSPGIILVGNPGNPSLTYASPNIEQILGYAPEEILEVPGFWLEHIHPDHRERFLAERQRVLDEKGDVFPFEVLFQHKDGTYRWLNTVVHFERDDAGEVVRALGYALDVTERKKAEAGLRESEEQFRAVAETALDAIVSADARGNIIYFNPGAERAFGYSAREVTGKPITLLMPERFIKDHKQGFARFLKTGEPRVIGKKIEFAGRKKDGSEFPVDVSLASWTAGKETFFTAILRDVTEHKLAKEAAEQASRAKSEFLSRMSHELRTPLNAILGFAQLLEMDPLAPEQRESVQHILKGGQHLLDLINEVLDITRIEIGRVALSSEPVPVRDVVKESLELIAPLAAQRDIRITGPAQIHPGHVLADRQRLKQVLLNFLSNAVKY